MESRDGLFMEEGNLEGKPGVPLTKRPKFVVCTSITLRVIILTWTTIYQSTALTTTAQQLLCKHLGYDTSASIFNQVVMTKKK